MKDLVGNQRAKDALTRLIAAGRVPNALLFTGPEGVGKKLFALELAKSLVCPAGVNHSACGNCAICRRVAEFTVPTFEKGEESHHVFFTQHPDIGFVLPFRRNLKVDAIRALEREANFLPYEAGARFFIVDDADKMNDAASNALLKTLEEPPQTSHIILIAARGDKLLPTIRSRCQIIRFGPASFDEIEKYLLSTEKFSPEDAALAARVSGGSVGRALEIVPSSFRTQRSDMLAVLKAAAAESRRDLLVSSEEMSDAKNKEEFEEKLTILQDLIHDVWLLKNGGSEESLLNVDLRRDLDQLSAAIPSADLVRWLAEIEEVFENLIVNINRRIATDSLFTSMAA
jgi:DNA polymerase-3 subunit delta'